MKNKVCLNASIQLIIFIKTIMSAKPQRTIYSTRLQQQKKNIIESFLKDYIYGGDGQFMPNVTQLQYETQQTYQGQTRDGKRHGTGIFQQNNGNIYLGEWQNDVYSGEGILIRKNGERYEGQMKFGKKNGQGIYYYSDGRVYKGSWSNNAIHGYGAQQGAHFYQGQWSNGLWHGKGYLRLKDGSVYEGIFAQGRPHGIGVFKNGLMAVSGQFREGQVSGQCLIQYKTGQKMKGKFKENQLMKAVLEFTNGDKYQGEMGQGTWSGQGTYFYTTGDCFIGNFKNGKKHGYGKMLFMNGDVYQGTWQGGVKHGQGRYKWKNGVVFQGNFWLDKRQGQGVLFYPNGIKIVGYWRNDARDEESLVYESSSQQVYNS